MKPKKKADKLIVLCASTGGPKAISIILEQITFLDSAMLIIQHLTPNFSDLFVQNLQDISLLEVKKVKDGNAFERNIIYVVPASGHLIFDNTSAPKILSINEVNSFYLPNMDVTLSSISNHFRKGIMIVVLSGMGNDAVNGIIKLKKERKNDVYVLVQGRKSSVIFGMNKRVIELNLADKILEVDEIPQEIKHWDKYYGARKKI